MADEQPNGIAWEAPEHHHIEKGSDWYWAVGIIAVAGAIAAIAFGNILFGIIILLGGGALILVGSRTPEVITHVVSPRGVRVGDELYPYSTLHSYFIDEEDPHGPQLLIKTDRALAPLIIMPIPEDAIDEIEYILEERLTEERLEEPLSNRLLEFLGF